MKKFIKELLIFFSVPLTCSIIGLLLSFYVSKTIDYKLDKNIKELYVGDSHIGCSVNDRLLNNSKNIATNSESFYFSYYKLKKIIEVNQHIKKVYLGASYHSLSNYNDAFINGEFSASVSSKYFYILPVKEQFKLVRWNLKNLSTLIKGIISINLKYIYENKTFDFGGYVNKFTHTIALKPSMEKRLLFQFYTGKKVNDFSEINLMYLLEIIKMCRANNVELKILNTPLHPYYKNKIPVVYINKFNEIVKTYNLEVIDFSDLKLSDNCFIPDGDHLSVKGACQFTKELVRI